MAAIDMLDAALDEWRHHSIIDGDAVRDLLLDLRSEAPASPSTRTEETYEMHGWVALGGRFFPVAAGKPQVGHSYPVYRKAEGL